MAAPSHPRLFDAWRVEALFSLRRSSVVALSNSNLSVQTIVPSRPSGNLTNPLQLSILRFVCYFHIAIWLRICQSILMQSQHTIEIDMACHRILLFCSLTCSEVRPMSLGPSTFALETRCSSATRSASRLIDQKYMCPYS